jgi:hypothetical protein
VTKKKVIRSESVKEEQKPLMFDIETRPKAFGNNKNYRFYSLFNGARGQWYLFPEVAEKEGLRHQKIIERMLKS